MGKAFKAEGASKGFSGHFLRLLAKCHLAMGERHLISLKNEYIKRVLWQTINMPAERFYLDSNVLVSLLREEMNGNFRLLFSEAAAFFDYVRKHGAVIVVSDLFFSEVQRKVYMEKEEVLNYLKSTNIKTEQSELRGQDAPNVRKFIAIGVHSADSKHLAIAVRIKCDSIVTFNKKDFEKATAFIRISEPKEFIEFI